MTIREATIHDIEQMQRVRNSVRENALSNPGLITDKDYAVFITERGKGWVCEMDHQVVGFSIVDRQEHNVWALFMLPSFEKQGIGRQLHDVMMDWYFSQTAHSIWLSTAPGTRAEKFYRQSGWKETGTYGKGEIKFEMQIEVWEKERIIRKE